MKRLLLILALLLPVPALAAGVSNPCTAADSVSTVVTPIAGGNRFTYTLTNTTACDPGANVWPAIVDFELPLTSPSDVSMIVSPPGWSYEFLTSVEYLARYGIPNPFNAPYILHWYDTVVFDTPNTAKMIVPTGWMATSGILDVYENYSAMFIFDSPLPAVTDGPYASSWMDYTLRIGDPPLPANAPPVNGFTGGDGGLYYEQGEYTAVPEPATAALLALGLVALAAMRVRNH